LSRTCKNFREKGLVSHESSKGVTICKILSGLCFGDIELVNNKTRKK